MGEFTDEMRVAVAAANAYIRRKIERDVAAGHTVHFMVGGRYLERTKDGFFELVQIGNELVRSHRVAPSTDDGDAFEAGSEYRIDRELPDAL